MSTTLNTKELTLVYNSTTSEGRKALAYAYSLATKVNKQDVKQLNLRPKDLLNRAHPYYQSHLRGCDFDAEGWLQVVAHNPILLKAPIALHGDRAVLCEPASLIYTLTEAQRKAVY
jgi:arsenate reductase